MNELDVAMLFIFDLGLFGMAYEPWSPHPPLMAAIGGIYLGARIAVYIIGNIVKHRRYRNGRKETE